jgi:nucleoside 2-deoxyribosyltransferase
MRRKKLYLASPLFCDSEKQTNYRIADSLQQWCDVFLPQRDGELVPRLVDLGLSCDDAYKSVFAHDIVALNECHGVVINLDGRVVDEGAAFELGYAYALGKTCVGYRTDVRVLLPWGQNPMIRVPLTEIFRSLRELEQWARDFSIHEESQPASTTVKQPALI